MRICWDVLIINRCRRSVGIFIRVPNAYNLRNRVCSIFLLSHSSVADEGMEAEKAEYYTILIGCCRCAWLSSLLTYEDIFACLVEEKPNKLLAINTRKTRYGENWSAWCLQSPSIAKSTWDFGVSTQVKSPEFGILTFEAGSSSQHVRSAQIALFYCAKWS